MERSVSVGSLTSTSRRAVVITGGSGSLASHIAKLVYSQWRDVQEIRLFDCVPPQQSLITAITGFTATQDKPKVSYYPGNLLDSDALRLAFVKADAVIHCAAAVENGSIVNRRRMKRVNIEGTRNVIQACLDCGVRALVFTGSFSQVLTSSKNELRVNEATDLPDNSELLFPYYGGTKNAAERFVLEANGHIGKDGIKLSTCSLRCPPMFGENDTVFVTTAIGMAKRCCGYFVPVGYTSARMQSLYFGNGAWAHVTAAQKLLDEDVRETVGGNFYYIGDYSPVCGMPDFMSQFLKPLGYRVFPLKIPIFLLMFLAYFIEFLLLLLALVGIDIRFTLNRGALRYLKLSHSISWEKARKELQYQPLYSHKTALARSMEYYRQRL